MILVHLEDIKYINYYLSLSYSTIYFHQQKLTIPCLAKNEMDWSIPPPSVPICFSHCAHTSANSTYENYKSVNDTIIQLDLD